MLKYDTILYNETLYVTSFHTHTEVVDNSIILPARPCLSILRRAREEM